jgi:hypothetical protein
MYQCVVTVREHKLKILEGILARNISGRKMNGKGKDIPVTGH